MGAATIYDVAALAGVSEATVSRVLNNSESVRPQTAQRVQAAIDQLGYVRNVSASALARQGSEFVGMLLRDPRNPVYGELLFRIQREAAKYGLQVVTISPSMARGANFELEGLSTLLGLKPKGVFIATGSIPLDRVEAIAQRTPTIVLQRPVDCSDVAAISFDEETAMLALAEQVAEHGHKRVYVFGSTKVSSLVEELRMRILDREFRARGVRVTTVTANSTDEIDRKAGWILENFNADNVTCCVALNDIKALKVMGLALEQGVSVPGALSITGVDGASPLVEHLGLTTIKWPLQKISELAVELMSEMIVSSGKEEKKQLKLSGTYINGKTLFVPEP